MSEQSGHHPGMPGREAEDMPGIDGTKPSSGPDRNLTPSGPDEGPGTDAQAVESDFDALLADTQRERDEYLDLAKRTRADFENYRKRMAAEAQAAAARGKAELAQGLIGVIDNLERALEAAGIDSAEPEEPLAQGILLTYRELKGVLERTGIEALDPKGEKFDPAWHEALSTQPANGMESGTVLEVMQKGYRLDDQLIRPARVVVSE